MTTNRAASLWLMAAWWALASGLLEVALLFQDARHGRSIHMTREFFWTTPTAELLVFGVAAALLTSVSLIWPSAAGPVIAAGILTGLAALSILPHIHWMAWWAIAALAVGLGAQAGRLVERFEVGTMRFVRATLPVLAVLVIAAGVLGHTRTARAEQRATPTGPAHPGAPNVLVIIWDAVRASDLSLYGYSRATSPRLDALAARGVTFDQAQSPASYTLLSHASLFTGRWPHQLSASWLIGLEQTPATLAEALGRRGYRTGAFSANHAYVSWEFGLLRGFARRDDYVLSPMAVANSAGAVRWILGFKPVRAALGMADKPERRDAENIRHHFLDWLDEAGRDQPFFAFLNMFDAHDPYLPMAPFDTAFGWPAGGGATERARLRRIATREPYDLTPAEAARLRDAYDGAIASMDHSVGLMLDVLSRRGVLDNTLVIVASDHGEAFGEHRMFGHGNSLYVEEIRIPLVMVMPGKVPAGVRVSGVASLRDVPATIADLLGIAGADWPLPGRSLVRHWSGSTPAATADDTTMAEIDHLPREGKPWFPVRRGNVRSITAWPYHLIMTGAEVELYDLRTDSAEQRSIAGQPQIAAVREALVAALQRRRHDAVPSKR